MPSADIKIIRQNDPPPWDDGKPFAVAQEHFECGLLEGGMSSGAPSVMMRFTLPDGSYVISQTSLGVFTSILAAARGAFPEAFDGGPFATP